MKKLSSKSLRKKADKYFSLAVRLRDCDASGFGNCITCKKKLHYKSGHCGHFMSRRHSATRYDEENCNLQCAGCNTFRGGEQYLYGLELDKKYGAGTAKKLAKQSRQLIKLTAEDYQQIITDSQEQIDFYQNT